MKKQPTSKAKSALLKQEKIHPWRLCPAGQHWVRTHPLQVPPSESNPTGGLTTRSGHCANNPSGKDQLYPFEIQQIAAQNFAKVTKMPCPISLGFPNGDTFDSFIGGWTQYWNDVLKPEIQLNPNIVKALIATESGFDPKTLADKKRPNSARGLMQLTNDSRKILMDESGELHDHFVTATRAELNEPNTNICAGIRWLFQKQKLASAKLGRNATWDEAIFEFKGCELSTPAQAKKLMNRFKSKLEELTKCASSPR